MASFQVLSSCLFCHKSSNRQDACWVPLSSPLGSLCSLDGRCRGYSGISGFKAQLPLLLDLLRWIAKKIICPLLGLHKDFLFQEKSQTVRLSSCSICVCGHYSFHCPSFNLNRVKCVGPNEHLALCGIHRLGKMIHFRFQTLGDACQSERCGQILHLPAFLFEGPKGVWSESLSCGDFLLAMLPLRLKTSFGYPAPVLMELGDHGAGGT